MNDKLIINQKHDFGFDITIKRKKSFFKTNRLLFYNNNDKLLGFFDMKDNVYDFGNKCFKINFKKLRLINGFHFNFSIRFLDNSLYADMEGYLSQFNRKKKIKANFISKNSNKTIITERFNFLPKDGIGSKKNVQFYINDDFFFRVYKTKNKNYKIIFDDSVNKNKIILIAMLTSCLFI